MTGSHEDYGKTPGCRCEQTDRKTKVRDLSVIGKKTPWTPTLLTFRLRWRDEAQSDFLLNLFLRLTPCLSPKFLALLRREVNAHR